MLRIVLLDCSESLRQKLENQGFNVESGTAGFCTGVRKLPSQPYQKDIVFYNPESLPENGIIRKAGFKDLTPEFDLRYLERRIRNGATFVAFVNRLSSNIEVQKVFYEWIPFMPEIEFTSDKVVGSNRFSGYPDSNFSYLAQIVTTANLSIPVLLKLNPPPGQDYPRDIFVLFWNGQGDCLGVLILRGQGCLIALPKFKSNEEVIETFLHRVAPQMHESGGTTTLTEIFISPAEQAARAELEQLQSLEGELKKLQEAAGVQMAAATREKVNVIGADDTARQILIYYDYARRQNDAALYYLYKIVEAIENKFGGETEGIRAVGAGAEWKSIKRLANESYRDARHAPKPGDVIREWTDAEIKKCFENIEVVITAYFTTLFPNAPMGRIS